MPLFVRVLCVSRFSGVFPVTNNRHAMSYVISNTLKAKTDISKSKPGSDYVTFARVLLWDYCYDCPLLKRLVYSTRIELNWTTDLRSYTTRWPCSETGLGYLTSSRHMYSHKAFILEFFSVQSTPGKSNTVCTVYKKFIQPLTVHVDIRRLVSGITTYPDFCYKRHFIPCFVIFTARCCASAILAMALCLSVRLSVCLSVRHKSEFY